MKFAFISNQTYYPWGGSEELWSQAALRLKEEGHEVAASVIWWPQLSPRILELEKRGINLFFLKQPHHRSLPIRLWHKLKRQSHFEEAGFGWLQKQNPDLTVISQCGNSDGLEWMNFCNMAKLPFVTKVSNNYEGLWLPDSCLSKMAQSYRAAKKVFCVSTHNLKLLEFQIGENLDNGAICWSRYAVPPDHPTIWPQVDPCWKLACVARLEPGAKGQDLLFKVLSQPRWQSRPVELNLYGAGPWEHGLRKMARMCELKNVHFRGHVSNPEKIWKDNHLLVLPSRYEGLPLVLLEAMWCGRPALVTDVGGSAEICIDDETGFVVEAPTGKILGEILERAWEKRLSWQSMGEAARSRAEKIMPKDPVGEFCRQLIECVNHRRS
jgi:glycosyltransferase involved in cell wall biosynthesis